MIQKEKDKLAGMFEDKECISYDVETDMFFIDFTVDVDDIWDEYTRIPILQKFIQHQIDFKYEYIYDYPTRDFHTEYEVRGYIYEQNRLGRMKKLPYDDIMEVVYGDDE